VAEQGGKMNILLAIDGSDSATEALRFLTEFPLPENTRVTLITVVDRDVFELEAAKQLGEQELQILHDTEGAVKDEGRQLLEREAKQLRALGIETVLELRIGDPAEEILHAAQELSADLVVVGSKGMTSIERFLIGSVSDRILKHAPCSVLIARERPAASTGGLRMLLAYDESAPSAKAAALCESLPVARVSHIHALTVLPLVHLYRQDISLQLNKIWHQRKLGAERALEQLAQTACGGCPGFSTEIVESRDVSSAILDTAEAQHSDLIVLGHKGRSSIADFLLGSVTRRIAEHAHCSVLVVR
jgi:nucleotide-binding universal stress UspA family protein